MGQGHPGEDVDWLTMYYGATGSVRSLPVLVSDVCHRCMS